MIRSTIPAKEYISQDLQQGGWVTLADLRTFVAAMGDWPHGTRVNVFSYGLEATRDLPT